VYELCSKSISRLAQASTDRLYCIVVTHWMQTLLLIPNTLHCDHMNIFQSLINVASHMPHLHRIDPFFFQSTHREECTIILPRLAILPHHSFRCFHLHLCIQICIFFRKLLQWLQINLVACNDARLICKHKLYAMKQCSLLCNDVTTRP